MPRLRLGTRGSALAVAQSGTVTAALQALGCEVEIIVVRTAGDDRPPDTVWGEGAFVKALEAALADGRVDLAVHSAKDVPTDEDPRLTIAAFPRREDPRDALITRDGTTLEDLPSGARIGTDSPRRVAFLRATRPDLRPHPLHGNVDTRLRRLDAGETDALVLAVAGLTRLGREDRITQRLAAEMLPPAPGQGALAVQVRRDDGATRSLVERLDDPETRAAVEAERAFLRASGGGCRAPIGVLARMDGAELWLIAGAAAADPTPSGSTWAGGPEATPADPGPIVAWASRRGRADERVALGAALAVELTRRLPAPAPTGPRTGPARVLVTRAADQAGTLVGALAAQGLEVVAVPTISVELAEPHGPLDDSLRAPSTFDWIVVTSANGAAAAAEALHRTGADPELARWAAVGVATAAALEERGISVSFVPGRSSGEGLAAELPATPGGRVLLVRGDLADGRLPGALAARGFTVDEVVAYRTIEAPEGSRASLRAAFAEGPFDALLFTSPSTVRGLLALLAPGERRTAIRVRACCIGPATARAASEAGFAHVVEAPLQSVEALAKVIASTLEPSRVTDPHPSEVIAP